MNFNILCRKANIGDLDRILEIESKGFTEEAFSRRQLRYLIQHAKGAVFVAVLQDVTVGYISLLTRSNICGRLYSLAVDPAHRGKGIAATLIDAAVDFVRERGIGSIFLEVDVDNLAAIALYEKKGFIKRAVKKAYYHSGTDAYSMVRALGLEARNGSS